MHISDSIITRSWSIQPFLAAASIIAYSPSPDKPPAARRTVPAPRDHIEIRHRRLHHNHVRSFFKIELDFAQGFAKVGPVHLIGTPVAEMRRRIRGLAKRPIKSGGKLRRVRKDRNINQPARQARCGSSPPARPSCPKERSCPFPPSPKKPKSSPEAPAKRHSGSRTRQLRRTPRPSPAYSSPVFTATSFLRRRSHTTPG